MTFSQIFSRLLDAEHRGPTVALVIGGFLSVAMVAGTHIASASVPAQGAVSAVSSFSTLDASTVVTPAEMSSNVQSVVTTGVNPAAQSASVTPVPAAQRTGHSKPAPGKAQLAADQPPDFSGHGHVLTNKTTASYWGHWHDGRPAANGERMNSHTWTAAHKTLPFGSVVRVTNLANDRSVTVCINDRGPYVQGRAIDVSETAARELAMVDSGVAKVRLEVSAERMPGCNVVASAGRI